MGEQSESFTPYDRADYLTGTEDVVAYLEAAIEEAGDDPAFIAQALGTIARSGNLSELARRAGMAGGPGGRRADFLQDLATA